jgi:hypothetical protein
MRASWGHGVSWCSTVGPRELCAHQDQTGREAHVSPSSGRAAWKCADRCRAPWQRSAATAACTPRAAARSHPSEHALTPACRAWALVALEFGNRVDDRPAMSAGEAQHALQRRQCARGRLRGPASALQLKKQLGDIVDRDRVDPPCCESRQEAPLKLVAVSLQALERCCCAASGRMASSVSLRQGACRLADDD